jgi:geranylgeranyl pyrophosphate synthase
LIFPAKVFFDLMNEKTLFFPLPPWAGQALASVWRFLWEELSEDLRSLKNVEDYTIPFQESHPLRPYLLLLVARQYGCPGPRATRVAASIQMIHIASLLHERLGDFSVPLHQGTDPKKVHHHQESMDILLGDFFFSKASCILIEDGERRIVEDMIQTSLASAEAQARVVILDENPSASRPSRCFEAVADKLSLLISLALRVGAILGEAPEEERKSLSDYGLFLGRALRIVKDLEFWSNPPESVDRFPKEVKYSHPLLLLWEREGREVWQQAARQLGEPAKEARETVRSRLLKEGFLEASLQKARAFSEEAARRLDGRPGLEGLDELRKIARVHLFQGLGAGEEGSR